MATIIPYDEVLQILGNKGFKSLYHNAGAFGFQRDVTPHFIGWIGSADPTIRAEAAHFTRSVVPPYAENLAKLASDAWTDLFPEPVWVMPRSHWAYELDFGSAAWLPTALSRAGVKSADLSQLTRGEAIKFEREESSVVGELLRTLLDRLSDSSDFQLIWPEKRVLCTVHHHQQLWWTTAEKSLQQSLAERVPTA